jgi:hypothetical protein
VSPPADPRLRLLSVCAAPDNWQLTTCPTADATVNRPCLEAAHNRSGYHFCTHHSPLATRLLWDDWGKTQEWQLLPVWHLYPGRKVYRSMNHQMAGQVTR